jgi:hypothetical protein
MSDEIDRSAYKADSEFHLYVRELDDEVVAYEHGSDYLGRGRNAAEAIEDYALAVRAAADGGDGR